MDFNLSKEHVMSQKAFRDFCRKEMAPLIEEGEETGKFPLDLFPKMGDLGYLGASFPEEYGGMGADKITECLLIDEVHQVSAGIGGALLVQLGLGTYPILKYGSEEQKKNYLEPAILGEKIASFSLTEPDAGSDAAAIQATADRDGDSYILNGTKTFITNCPICDYTIFVGYTDPSQRGKGINLFIVDKDTPGFDRGKKLDKLGLRIAETSEPVFSDCRVPASAMIGTEEDVGFAQLEETLRWGRIVYGARCSGLSQAIYDMTAEYTKKRMAFGKSIASYQVNKFKLAEMAMYIDIIRTITYRAAWMHDQGMPCAKEASMLKLFATEAAQKIADMGMQLHGGYGYMMEAPVQRFWRDARAFTITEGTSEVQHLVIAKELGL
jgi:alkylation response protein AidB-like acyl-CoA dehydrogenase